MMSKESKEKQIRQIYMRLMDLRTRILQQYPFYGYLMMKLKLALAPCGTACTDMKHLIFDPDFLGRLSDEEAMFVMMHEVCHCSNDHLGRGSRFHPKLFNIACDINVNSTLMLAMNRKNIRIDGAEPMHLTPEGKEGYCFSAEEIYDQLLKEMEVPGDCPGLGGGVHGEEEGDLSKDPACRSCPHRKDCLMQKAAKNAVDSHETWEEIPPGDPQVRIWKDITRECAEIMRKRGCGDEISPGLRKQMAEDAKGGRLDWRSLLRSFLTCSYRSRDYTFAPPDKRFSDSEYILPYFNEAPSLEVNDLWFVVDTSGSVSDDAISQVFGEIAALLEMFPGLKGRISFFDTGITEPVEFSDAETIRSLRPVGGGGTDFYVPFRYMKEHMRDKLPAAIVFLTDGYAYYPEEQEALDVPVLWVILEDGPEPDWGTKTHLYTEQEETDPPF